jgi:hypothetical protein
MGLTNSLQVVAALLLTALPAFTRGGRATAMAEESPILFSLGVASRPLNRPA